VPAIAAADAVYCFMAWRSSRIQCGNTNKLHVPVAPIPECGTAHDGFAGNDAIPLTIAGVSLDRLGARSCASTMLVWHHGPRSCSSRRARSRSRPSALAFSGRGGRGAARWRRALAAWAAYALLAIAAFIPTVG
jgi:hypothetical protein